jgi:pyruvate dehydrogenase E2 component (dihydrolipoamide acetyltransferase)
LCRLLVFDRISVRGRSACVGAVKKSEGRSAEDHSAIGFFPSSRFIFIITNEPSTSRTLIMLASRLMRNYVRRVAQTSLTRSFSPSAVAMDDDLPYHLVVGMPALSPTMETGILAEWYVSEGSKFIAGQSVAKIETDKASIDFEAQDEGFMAKILIKAGGDDIVIGTPIMVTVEDEEDVAAFANFVVEAAPEPVAEEPKVEATPPPPSPPPAAAAAAVAPVAPPAPVAEPEAVAPPEMEELAAAVAPVMSTGWGNFAKINSPIAKTLSKQQHDYVEKFGTTGQVPL